MRRMVNQDRNVFAAGLLKLGVGDAMITGLTRTFAPIDARTGVRFWIPRRAGCRSACT